MERGEGEAPGPSQRGYVEAENGGDDGYARRLKRTRRERVLSDLE